jgi:hypothetical protein
MSSSVLIAASVPLLVGNDPLVRFVGGTDQPLSRIESHSSLFTRSSLPLRTALPAVPLLRLFHSAQNRERLSPCQSL